MNANTRESRGGREAVKPKAGDVLRVAGVSQRLLDMAAQPEAAEGVRQGLEDIRKGRVRPAREFFDEFEARKGIQG
jgi:hypothetical protein